MKITFPSLTAEQIVEKYDNKLGKGKLLYDIYWYKNEDFFTKEKCRKGTQEIITDLTLTFNKSWDECNKMTKGTPIKMLNFAELLWYVIKIPNFLKNEYSWTSSRTSDGFFVNAGYFDDDGGNVHGDWPGNSASDIGCAFSAVALKSSSIDTSKIEPGLHIRAVNERLQEYKNWLKEEVDKLPTKVAERESDEYDGGLEDMKSAVLKLLNKQ